MITLVIATRNAHKVGEIRAILGGGFRYLTLNDFPGAPEVVEDAGTFAGNAAKKAVELARWLASEAGRALSPQSAGGLRLNSDRSPKAPLDGRLGEAAPPEAEVLSSENVFVLADDSGLEVDALGGAPGVHSARFAALDTGVAGNSSTADNNAKLLRLMRDVPADRRTARFRCVIALAPVARAEATCASPVCDADESELRTELFEGACEGRIEPAPRGQGGFGYDPLFIPDGYDLTFAELGEETKNQLSHRARALAGLRRCLMSRHCSE